MSTPRRAAAVLRASERACEFFVERGSTEATVAELAAATELNERTFHRYFPTKQDVVRPVFDWGAATMADTITGRPDLGVRRAVLVSFASIVGGDLAPRTRALFPLVFADPGLRAVLLAVYHDAEEELRRAIASRGVLPVGSTAAYVAAATLVGATRVALEVMVDRGADPQRTLREALALLPGELVGDVVAPRETSARS